MTGDWVDMFSRAAGSHMTQMDVDGGRVLTVAGVEVVAYDKKSRTALVHWRDDVLPWLMPQQEGLLLASIGWRPHELTGRRLFINRDPSDTSVRWRCGKRKLQRQLVRCPDPDPLWGLAVVRWGLGLDAVDSWALDKGLPAAPSTLTGEARDRIAARLDTSENHAAIVAFIEKGNT
jgi:hypothetical protein